MRGGRLMFGYQDDDQQVLNDQMASVQTQDNTTVSDGNDTQAGYPNDASQATAVDETATAANSDTLTHTDPVISAPSMATDQGSDLSNSAAGDDLLDLKQKALTQLTPIVDHLDQTPEERFNTTMMMIQASDNQSLLKQAYEAAQEITDEKIKAQALLDLVNEINYFTHPHHDQD